jgi:ABC-2 type transport system permease protein
MNHLLNITKKELRELLTPGTIVSILAVVIMFSILGSAMSGESESEAAPKEIGIVFPEAQLDDPVCGTLTMRQALQAAYYSTYGVNTFEHIHMMDVDPTDQNALANEVKSNGYAVALVIPDTLASNISSKQQTEVQMYYVYVQTGIFGAASSMTGTVFMDSLNKVLEATIIGTDATFTMSPLKNQHDYTLINGNICEGITPYQIAATLMGQSMMIPIIVMMVIVIVGSIVISSMGTEKENKTLETLLTLPIKRTVIVSGKLLAAAIMGLVYGACYLVGMMMYTNGLTSGITGSSADISKYGLTMDPLDWVVLLIVLFLAIFAALGICMILGAFTKNYKMAQTMTLPISGLALIPMFIFMFASWETLPLIGKVAMFAIPFSHPMMAMNNLMFGDIMLVAGGIVYLLVFDIIMILITVRIYNSDILITGLDQSKFLGRMAAKFSKKEAENGNQ